MKARGKGGITAVLPMYLFTLLFILGPFVYMLIISFSTRSSSWGVVMEPSVAGYKSILEPVYMKTFISSVQLALTTTVLCLLIGYPFAWFMARLTPKWRNAALFLLIIPFWTSSLMRLYGWMIIFRASGPLDSVLMWLGLTDAPLRLLYTYPAVVAGMVYALLPFMIYSVYGSAEKLDRRLLEASRDLGASPVRSFVTVGLPLTMPGVLSGIILTFVPSMGLYYIADLLGGSKTILVGTLIQEQLLKTHDWPFAAALSVALLLVTSLFLFLYRKLTGAESLEGLV